MEISIETIIKFNNTNFEYLNDKLSNCYHGWNVESIKFNDSIIYKFHRKYKKSSSVSDGISNLRSFLEDDFGSFWCMATSMV